MSYNWQLPDWPKFSYEIKQLEPDLLKYAQISSRLSGQLDVLDSELRSDTLIEFMVKEALKSSQIEGEELLFKDVKSSIRNQLGINKPLEQVTDLRAKGIAQMILHVRDTYRQPLSQEMLFQWHQMLFLTQSRLKQIEVGQWRTHQDSMQIVSGIYGKWTVHFEAPPSVRVPFEMQQLVAWFNETAPLGQSPILHAPVRAAIAHLYFESIHPFEDGNGRIGRALAEKALLQQSPFVTVLNLSTAIEAKKKAYYRALEEAQRKNDVTAWLDYFVNMLLEAQKMAETSVQWIIRKTNLIAQAGPQTTERQLTVIKRMLREGPSGFIGGISAKKYTQIAKCSKATATRDLVDLLEKKLIQKLLGTGKNTAYELTVL